MMLLRNIRIRIGLAVCIAVAGGAAAASFGFDPDRYLAHIKYLAAPEMRGRATGSPELEKAAQYISDQFRHDGLLPPDNRGYLQPFEVTPHAELRRIRRSGATLRLSRADPDCVSNSWIRVPLDRAIT
jgi:hypothetical protein